jgi:hypothetical protein
MRYESMPQGDQPGGSTTSNAGTAIKVWYFSSAIGVGVAMGAIFPTDTSYLVGDGTSFGWTAFWGSFVLCLIGGIPVLAFFDAMAKTGADLTAIRKSLHKAETRPEDS